MEEKEVIICHRAEKVPVHIAAIHIEAALHIALPVGTVQDIAAPAIAVAAVLLFI